jgi:uncharacterized protein YuzB (UPF0349 family)
MEVTVVADVKKVNICKKCSGIDKEDLKGIIKVKDMRIGCIQKCGANEGKVFGFINGEFVVCDTKEEFIEKVKVIA